MTIAKILILSLSLLLGTAHAAELRIVSADFDPYSYQTSSGGSGVMHEIVQKLAEHVGQSPEIEFLPWARAQTEAQTKPFIGIMPLARVPEREEKYTWLLHILDDPYVLFAKKDSKVDISSIEAAKNLRIGTFRGSLAEILLPKMGFNNFKSVNTDAQNARMLKADRIDAWVAPLSFRNKYESKGGLPGHELKVGATLVILHEYLATSKSVDPETVRKWQKAFESMKNDGSYRAIMKKHGFEPLK